MRLNPFRFLLVIVFTLSCVACATAQHATPDEDSAAKRFNVTNGKSNIYIYRNENLGLNTEISVDIDDKHAGNTLQETFILQTVDPGKHKITAHAENTSEIELITEAGKTYFVWLEVELGVVVNRGHLHSVSEEKGKAGVLECRLVK
jgi:hypothetical protein